MKSDIDRILQPSEAALGELRGLVREAEKIISEASGEVGEATLAALKDRFEAAQQRVTRFYGAARDGVAAGAKRTDEAIRDHPYPSIAIALGLGLVAGVLLGRRTN